ncbi:hypothetical protein PHMEG_00040012 [Phytophthora megakarya]|uniref:Uncharacterized protein n=1 Tax=Phytophthora megakarya TaxID=4795 RepID=A0A225UFQ9_9STRA|nr:hypothetical protein PHMEG_00040012 [Phytophthora megakarya]
MWDYSSGSTGLFLDYAAFRGDISWLEWAHMLGITSTTAAMDRAAGNGRLDTVEWLHRGRTEVVWLAANRREECTCRAFRAAATRGHLRRVTNKETCLQ